MQTIQIAGQRGGFASTRRIDRWWIAPASTAIGLVVFFGYPLLRAVRSCRVMGCGKGRLVIERLRV
jgi:hypothetical protein